MAKAKAKVKTKVKLKLKDFNKTIAELNKLFEWEGTDDALAIKDSEEEAINEILEGITELQDSDKISPLCKKVVAYVKADAKDAKDAKELSAEAAAEAAAEAGNEEEENQKKGKGKGKKASKPKDEKKDPKEKLVKANAKEKSFYGHRVDTQGADIDKIVCDGKGHKLEKIAEKCGISNSRVTGHLKHLEKDKGCTVTEKNGIYTVTGGGE